MDELNATNSFDVQKVTAYMEGFFWIVVVFAILIGVCVIVTEFTKWIGCDRPSEIIIEEDEDDASDSP